MVEEREEGSGVRLPGILEFCFVLSAGLGHSEAAPPVVDSFFFLFFCLRV